MTDTMTKVKRFAWAIMDDAQKQTENLENQNFFYREAKLSRDYVGNGGKETLERMMEILKKEWYNNTVAYAIKEMTLGITSGYTRKFIQDGGLD